MMSSCFYNGTHKYDLSVKTEAKVDQPEDTSFPAYAIAIIVVVVLILLLLAVVAVVVLCAICYRRKRFLDSFKVLRVIISLCYAHVHSLPLLPTFLSLSLLSLPLPSYTPMCIYMSTGNNKNGRFLYDSFPQEGSEHDAFFLHSRGLGRTPSNRDIIRHLVPLEDEWEIPPVVIVTEKQLGEGCFGQVYKGFVRGPIPGSRMMKNSIHTTVAVKYLKGMHEIGLTPKNRMHAISATFASV